MSDYIKIPTFPKHDLLRGVEAISPYPRVDSQQPRQEGSSQQQSDTAEKKDGLARRRFLSLRRLIDELKESAQITKLDFGTAYAELRNLGLAIVEEELIDQLLQLKIPLQSIEQLLQQINQNRSGVSLGSGRRISSEKPSLFPASVAGLLEYNLKIEGLKVRTGPHDSKIVNLIDQEGLWVVEQNRLRLTFSRLGPTLEATSELLKLKISVLLGVLETDEADRRAILYQRADKSYGVYADKMINLSI